jgi:hypothetical protein
VMKLAVCLDEFSEVAAADMVIRLHEHLSKPVNDRSTYLGFYLYLHA